MSQTANQSRATNARSREADGRRLDPHLAKELIESLGGNNEGEVSEQASDAARSLVRDAQRERATDIHLDPEQRGLRIRMRIDGAVRGAALLPRPAGDRLINQLKSLAGIDPVAQFDPDDARFALRIDERDVDLRLALVPCLDGHKLTLRVLDPLRIMDDMEGLGMSEKALRSVRQAIASRGGMFVIVGPVGSGKTTTLYCLLHTLRSRMCSVSTLEDPVEYRLDGINQIQINPEQGLTYSTGITALSRHDPDVILVGELRDAATTRAAYGAAALGRSIFTTLHARDTAGAVTTLRHYGLGDRDIATTLSTVVSQRLVRKLCRNCRWQSTPTDEEKRWFEQIHEPCPRSSWQSGDCTRCGRSGYSGQIGVFEVWRLDEDDYQLVFDGGTEREIRENLASREHETMLADALGKAQLGQTSFSEVQRIHSVGPAFGRPSACRGG
jgi:type II secretory ATPase GspE/PulE/Tfp pilus assembly ATPase PilB-like protein